MASKEMTAYEVEAEISKEMTAYEVEAEISQERWEEIMSLQERHESLLRAARILLPIIEGDMDSYGYGEMWLKLGEGGAILLEELKTSYPETNLASYPWIRKFMK